MNKINLYNKDCLSAMIKMKDNEFDLAIVDPPYGIARFGNRVELLDGIDKKHKINKWDIKPNKEYFLELFRVSKKQIIFGANNFKLPETEYFLIWDKMQTVENFASAEYAWTNIKKPAKVFRYSIHQVMSDRKKENGKIHPTQKPIKLYEWILINYAKNGDKILDTHLGSGSSAIASFNYGFEFDGYEIDKEYFDNAVKRVKQHTKQQRLF
jgi:site-specific DNA-methyltransferase (adenine-specific)